MLWKKEWGKWFSYNAIINDSKASYLKSYYLAIFPLKIFFFVVFYELDFTLAVCNCCRNGLNTDGKYSFAEMMTEDVQTCRDERCYRLWINSLGIDSYVNNVFEDVRNG